MRPPPPTPGLPHSTCERGHALITHSNAAAQVELLENPTAARRAQPDRDRSQMAPIPHIGAAAGVAIWSGGERANARIVYGDAIAQ